MSQTTAGALFDTRDAVDDLCLGLEQFSLSTNEKLLEDVDAEALDGLIEEAREESANVMGALLAAMHVRAARNRRRNARLPVSRLPVELLEDILILALQHEDGAGFEPFILSHVCSFWRNAALSTPQMWRRICIGKSEIPGKFPLTHLVRARLERSAKLPLSLCVDFRGMEYEHVCEVWYFCVTQGHCQRWEHARFILTPEILCYMPSTLYVRYELPRLQTLELEVDETNQGPTEMTAGTGWWNLPDAMPLLSRIKLTNFPPDCTALPYEQLREMELRTRSMAEAMTLLAQCPNLERFTVDQYGGEFEWGGTEDMGYAVNATLKELTVAADLDGWSILEGAVLPQLQRLVILDPVDIVILESFLERSSPPLHSLVMERIQPSTSAKQLVSIFRRMPDLTHLHFPIPFNPWCRLAVLRDLALPFTSGSKGVVPRLEALTIDFAGTFEARADFDNVVQIVLSRVPYWTAGRLESLTVLGHGDSSRARELKEREFSWREHGVREVFV